MSTTTQTKEEVTSEDALKILVNSNACPHFQDGSSSISDNTSLDCLEAIPELTPEGYPASFYIRAKEGYVLLPIRCIEESDEKPYVALKTIMIDNNTTVLIMGRNDKHKEWSRYGAVDLTKKGESDPGKIGMVHLHLQYNQSA